MTPNLRTLVVDDEPRARSRMRRLLEGHRDVLVVGEASNGDEAIQQVLALRPDVVFLDVRMPGPLGTQVAETLATYLPEGVRPAIVFTTAHAEHAVEAFAVDGVDYLLKPVERDRLAEALRRVRRTRWAAGTSTAPAPAPTEAPAVLTGHHGAGLEAVAVGALVAVEVEDGTVFATSLDGDRTRLGDSLAEIEASLPSPPFLRVSRGALIHVERVLRLNPAGSGTWEAEMEGGKMVRVSRRRARHLRERMGLD